MPAPRTRNVVLLRAKERGRFDLDIQEPLRLRNEKATTSGGILKYENAALRIVVDVVIQFSYCLPTHNTLSDALNREASSSKSSRPCSQMRIFD